MFQRKKQLKLYTVTAFLLTAFIFQISFFGASLLADEADYGDEGTDSDSTTIVIHLDGLSADRFYEEMEKGNLPHLQEFFPEESMRLEAITYFPPLTPAVITRIREGLPADEGEVVDWDGYSREDEEFTSSLDTYSNVLESTGRRSWGSFLRMWPGMNRLAGPELASMAELVGDYSLLEYYWISTDFYGHAFGEEAQLSELQRFDQAFGRLISRLDGEEPDSLNVLIYSDHGMVFGEGVEVEEPLKEELGDDLKDYSYPNIYLQEEIRQEADRDEMARRIAHSTPLNFVLSPHYFGEDEILLKGYGEEGSFEITSRPGESGREYSYNYEGFDPFSYSELGYEGEYLTADEWLDLTGSSEYPASPPSLIGFADNPGSGDLIAVLDPPYFQEYSHVREGNHHSLHEQDMRVPLLVRGEKFSHLYGDDIVWMPDIFGDEMELDLADPAPAREEHEISLWHGVREEGFAGQLTLSPAYRPRFGLESGTERREETVAWGEFDLYSSYFSRLWAGAGVSDPGGDNDLLGRLRYDFRINRLTLSYLNYIGAGESSFRISFNLTSNFDLKLLDFTKLGFNFSW